MRRRIYANQDIYATTHEREGSMIDATLAPEEVQARLLRAIAHPFRFRMLEVLADEEECVCHLSTLFDRPQPFVSQHLAALKEAGLVTDRRVAQRVFYRSADPRIAELLRTSRVLAGGSEPSPAPRGPLPGCNCPKCDPDAR